MRSTLTVSWIACLALFGCNKQQPTNKTVKNADAPRTSTNIPPLHPTNIVSQAIASKDHTTLVAAIKAVNYVTSVAASGPLTVFAPTNSAFEQLPAGTVETLLKPENHEKLRNILKYHVTTSALKMSYFVDGQNLAMANGEKVKITVKDGKVTIGGANILASSPASNGMLHIIDKVLLPPGK
ncbi:MAG: fasciclin domain-containing protein [Planctomycetes bacterium]|nr:fasciclin domain-containing protein [Planctomycetota bacterium]